MEIGLGWTAEDLAKEKDLLILVAATKDYNAESSLTPLEVSRKVD